MNQLIGIVFLGVGAYALWWGSKVKKRAEDSLSWRSSEGKIVSSDVITDYSGGYRSSNRTYKADILYEYQVGRTTYTHDKICVGGQLQVSWGNKAEDYCQKYPEGKTVQVFYNPDDPQDACLERREETSLFVKLVGGVFGVVGLLILTNFF